jgi:salicylate hydroxylase
VLVGADGLWSNVRHAIADGTKPVFVGATATRTVIAADAAGPLAIPAVGLWLTPGVHMVHYPVRRGREVAVVVIAAEDWQGTEWDAQADAGPLRACLAGFHPALADVLAAVAEWRKWALHRLPPLARWTSGRITLLGDAAHPMLPYLAQGGVMALEDALVLARWLSRGGDEAPGVPGVQEVQRALLGYEGQRRQRAARVQALSLRNGHVFHMRPPLSWARNGVLRLLPGARLMAGFDWLYGWQPEAESGPDLELS